jgi:hypothetical protein
VVTSVSDARSNANDQIVHAARVLGRSDQRRRVFSAIYAGKRQVKTVTVLMRATGLSRKRVLTEGKSLANNHIVSQMTLDGETAYRKDGFYSQHRDRILRLAQDPSRLRALPTKTNPRVVVTGERVELPRSFVRVKQVTIDDIDSFARVKNVKLEAYAPKPLDESVFKGGLQSIVREEGVFRDWGGERNDLWTTRLFFRGRRRAAAFAFKGRGTRGKLTPGKMGKNGDQIQRLFQAPADFFIIQYWREIDQSVVELARSLAVAKSATEGREICFCVIDGQDAQRLMAAYPKAFRAGG